MVDAPQWCSVRPCRVAVSSPVSKDVAALGFVGPVRSRRNPVHETGDRSKRESRHRDGLHDALPYLNQPADMGSSGRFA